jgi:hypothetical protein
MRFDEIRYTKTLDYCDGISVFEANDPIGGTYVASYLEAIEGGDRYLVVGCRPEMLRLFRHGACDLRELLTVSATHGWYVADLLGTRRPLFVRDVGAGPIPDGYLPDSGYMILDSEVDHGVVADAVERNNFVLHISVEPPGTSSGHSVGITTFNTLMRNIQELARCAAEEVEEVTESRRNRNASRLEVVKISEGSVVVTLQGADGLDERRESVLPKAFERLDGLFDKMEMSQQLSADTAEYAPSTIGAYAKLMKLLKDEETGFHYTWAAPTTALPSHRAVSLERAQELESELPRTLMERSDEVPAREVVIRGTLEAANQLNRKWTLRDAQRVLWNGTVEKGGLGLDELIIGGHYTFTCLEQRDDSGSRRSKKPTLYLKAISE